MDPFCHRFEEFVTSLTPPKTGFGRWNHIFINRGQDIFASLQWGKQHPLGAAQYCPRGLSRTVRGKGRYSKSLSRPIRRIFWNLCGEQNQGVDQTDPQAIMNFAFNEASQALFYRH